MSIGSSIVGANGQSIHIWAKENLERAVLLEVGALVFGQTDIRKMVQKRHCIRFTNYTSIKRGSSLAGSFNNTFNNNR